MRRKNVKADILLGAVLLAAAGLLFLLLRPGESGGQAEVICRGETVCVLSLAEDGEREIAPGFCVTVENGAVRVSASDCAEQDCVRHRPVSRRGESIVCAPREIVIRITGDPETDFVI